MNDVPPPRSRWPGVGFPVILMVVVTGVALTYWRLLSGEPLFTHDFPTAYVRALEYLMEFRAGAWPALLPTATAGGGNAFPLFYPPLTPWLSSLAAGLLHDPVWGVHLVAWLSVPLSGLTFGLLLRRLGIGRVVTLASVIAYLTLPYRYSTLLVRGAVAEGWSWVFLPLVLLGVLEWARGRRIPIWWPLAVACQLVTHVVLGAWAGLFIGAVGLLSMPTIGRLKAVPGLATGALIAILLASAYLVPTLALASTTRLADVAVTGSSVSNVAWHRIPPVAAIGLGEKFNGLRLEFGLPVLVLPFLLIVVSRSGSPGGVEEEERRRLASATFLGTVAVAVTCLFPDPLLVILPSSFRLIQFPWRLLVVVGLLGCTSLALMLEGMQLRARRLAAAALTVLALAGGVFYGTEPRQQADRFWHRPVDELLVDARLAAVGWTTDGEHLPTGTTPWELAPRVARAQPGGGNPALLDWSRLGAGFHGLARQDVTGWLELPLVAYPIWRAESDTGERLTLSASAGLIRVRLPAGKTSFRIVRTWGRERRAGLGLSLLGLLALGLWSWMPAVRTVGRIPAGPSRRSQA